MTAVDRPVLLIGGAGFIGCNLAARLASSGRRIRIFDDLSRPGVERNVSWLRGRFADRVEIRVADVREREAVGDAVRDVDAVFHLAAQVSVATSLVDPREDFSTNAAGTLEVLEAIRRASPRPPLIYASTSEVYGGLPDLPLEVHGERWRPIDAVIDVSGIDESHPLRFLTPLGCSKGAADQYVLDYAHCFGLPATVFRLSSVYGPRQLATDGAGWIAHFIACALADTQVTVFGDGRQVRDVLFVDDLIDAMLRAWSHVDLLRGRAFNIGGGPANTLSPRELLGMIEKLVGRTPRSRHEEWRSGDRRYYVSNTSAFHVATGWRPTVGPRDGIEAAHAWLREHHEQRPMTLL